ncbi:hypothetical protein SISNIDRAFT_390492, partial [Sistotremastrum niveocremeum HHB9708]
LMDCENRVFALRTVIPTSAKVDAYLCEVLAAAEALQKELSTLKSTHNRGAYVSALYGYSFGGGQTEPCNFHQTAKTRKAWRRFLHNEAVRWMIKYAMSLFRNWFPRLWAHYVELHQAVCLRPENEFMDILAPQCPFFAMSQNFGPQAVSIRHKDTKNLISGLCLIFVLGVFRHQVGGHLVLHEAKVLLEAKHGSILMIPSAALTHENLKILEGEQRYVFTMYSAGGIFRYRDHGWM